MNTEFLKQAHERVPSIPVLVNLISKRTKQLIAGEKPLVGRLISEVDFDAIAKAEDAKTRWQKHAASKSIFAL